jgi:hypothetical protein
LSAEGQAHEILSFIALRQQSESNNPGQVNNVLGSHDQQALLYSGTYQFSVVQSIDGAGNLNLSVNPYLIATGFQQGTGGTFKGNSPEKYCLEVLMFLQNLERNPALNPSSRNYVTGTYNSDTGLYQGSFSLPVVLSLEATTGVVTYEADPYLL